MAQTRRTFLAGTAAATAFRPAAAGQGAGATRLIPSTGERIQAVGIGSWITFNVGDDRQLRDECADVIEAFFEEGGGMIDSSPMYGSSQSVIGYGLARLQDRSRLFSADKVWTNDRDGAGQIAQTRANWGVPSFDLLQVHNLMQWRSHLPLLREMKAAGQVRHVGITTSHGRRHDDLEDILRSEDLDFVQLTYNAVDREAEARLLPLARDRGIAVIVNRPFQRGALTGRMQGQPLPGWAGDVGATSWPQLLLKFVLAHPAVTVAIPATTRVDHVRENKRAALGPPLDETMRRQIVDVVRST